MAKFEKYVSKYAEAKKSKKQILEDAKVRLAKVKESLKKFKEDEAKELEKAVDEIEAVITDVIDSVGVESPAVDTLVQAGQEVCAQADVAGLTEEDEKKDDEKKDDEKKDDEKKEESKK